VDIYAADCMGKDCVARLDAGLDARLELSTIKMFAAEMCERVLDRSMQVHGAMGLTNELGLVEGWHTARAMRIADGTSETLRATIAREVLKGRTV